MSASSVNAFEKLNSANYLNWKLRIELILTKEDHWDIVIGDEPFPSVSISASTKGKERDEDDQNEGATSKLSDAQLAWRKRDRNARTTILLTVSDNELTHVRDCKTSNKIWCKLAEIYEPKGFAQKRYLRR